MTTRSFSLGDVACRAKFGTILPRVERHARVYLRQVKCYHKKADLIAAIVAIAWKWLLRLTDRGKDATHIPSTLAKRAAQAARNGRTMAGKGNCKCKPKCAMDAKNQQLRSSTVSKLPDCSTLSGNPLAEVLIDNTITAPPDAAAFRCDFPAWVGTQSQRDRCLIYDMAQGEPTLPLARRYRMSPARLSQLRRKFFEEWQALCA